MANFRMDKIIKRAHELDWKVKDTGKALMFFPPKVELGIVTTHKTPSDVRARQNFRRDMERRGFDWPKDVKV